MPSFRSKIAHWFLGLMPASAEPDFRKTREMMENTMRRMPSPRGVHYQPTTLAGVPAEWVTVPDAANHPVILYLHGGAYVSGSPRTHRIMTGTLAKRCQMRVLALDYRLAPEYPFPAGLDDALAGYRALLAEGIPAQQIVIAGDSAGGGLSLALLLRLRELGESLPAGAALLSPWTDLSFSGASLQSNRQQDKLLNQSMLEAAAQIYIGADSATNPLISQIYASLAGLPPLLIQVGSYEILLDDAKRIAEQVQQAGGDVDLQVYDGVGHVWHLFTFVPEAQRAFDEIARFIQKVINSSDANS